MTFFLKRWDLGGILFTTLNIMMFSFYEKDKLKKNTEYEMGFNLLFKDIKN